MIDVFREDGLMMVDIDSDTVRVSTKEQIEAILRGAGMDIGKGYTKIDMHLSFKSRYVQIIDGWVKPEKEKKIDTAEDLVDYRKMKKDDLVAECVRLGLSEGMDLISFNKENLIELIVGYRDVGLKGNFDGQELQG